MNEWEAAGIPFDHDEGERKSEAWDRHNRTVLASLFDGLMFLEQYEMPGMGVSQILDVRGDPKAYLRSHVSTVRDRIARLRAISAQVDLCPAAPAPKAVEREIAPSAADRVVLLCRRFPIVARQIQKRHGQRPSLAIDDEYDVQDLMHALLRVDFDDIRGELWTPSYAGKGSRIDFFLKREGLALEIKMSREGLSARGIGDQLIVDVDRYKEQPGCRALICFVYDPDRRIGNPAELENDLSAVHASLAVTVVVAPKD